MRTPLSQSGEHCQPQVADCPARFTRYTYPYYSRSNTSLCWLISSFDFSTVLFILTGLEYDFCDTLPLVTTPPIARRLHCRALTPSLAVTLYVTLVIPYLSSPCLLSRGGCSSGL